jgi:hypothetical protein
MAVPSKGLGGLAFGGLFSLIGAGLYAAVRLSPEAANAPEWVIDAAAGTFFLAGLSVMAEAVNWKFVSRLASLGVVYLLAVPGLWMLFADDPSCSVSGVIGGAAFGDDASSLTCRAVFGGGAIVTLLAALAFTWVAVRRRSAREVAEPGSRSPDA